MILSVDLASRRVQDNGIALLEKDGARARVRLVPPIALGLGRVPEAASFAEALVALAAAEGARLILLDGPQGWRAEASPLVHARVCERETQTPGKTGLPGVVKPATWTRMATFSVALFDALDARGWPRLRGDWQGERAAIETFPTHAWRMLGHPALPAKSRRANIGPWRAMLTERLLEIPPPAVSHDELQAVVSGLAGLSMLEHGLSACDMRGAEPVLELGVWREGFIVSPRKPGISAAPSEPY